MRVILVCGSRTWTNDGYLRGVLDALHSVVPFDAVIEGEAPGADKMAGDWADDRGVPILTRDPWVVLPAEGYLHADHHVHLQGRERGYPALWYTHGSQAGLIRNQEMLDAHKPDAVIAFSLNIERSSGTRDMVRRARKALVPVLLYTGPSSGARPDAAADRA